jgi:hypothetical protein
MEYVSDISNPAVHNMMEEQALLDWLDVDQDAPSVY